MLPNSLLECDSDNIGDMLPRHWSLQPSALGVTCHMSAPGGVAGHYPCCICEDVTDVTAVPLVPMQLVTSARLPGSQVLSSA